MTTHMIVRESAVGAAGYPVITVWPAEFEAVFLGARARGASFAEALCLASVQIRPLREIRKPNKVVDNGLNLLRDWAYGDAPAGISRIALGTDGTAEAGIGTQLGVEVYRDLLADKEKLAQKIIWRYYLTTTMANNNTLREAGLVAGAATAAPNTGTLYARATHETIVKDSSKAVTYQWETPWARVTP